MNHKNRAAIIGIVFIALIVMVVTYVGVGVSVQNSRDDVDAQWSQVENVMQRRADLIPNLVSTVKGQMNHEDNVIKQVTDARTKYVNASTPNDKMAADDEMRSGVQTLVSSINENYPDLASSESVKTLMVQLEGSENRISVERRRYIEKVNDFNKSLNNPLTGFVAGTKGIHRIDQYKATTGADKAPAVDLGQ